MNLIVPRRKSIDTKTGKPIVKGGTKKPTSPKTPNPVLDKVTKSIYASGGKIMRSGSNQQKKVRVVQLVEVVSILKCIKIKNNSRKMQRDVDW